jgi:hypothetical protein
METDYQTLTRADYEQVVKKFLMFNLMTGATDDTNSADDANDERG